MGDFYSLAFLMHRRVFVINCKVCGFTNHATVALCSQCGVPLNISDQEALLLQQQMLRPRRRGRRRKHWLIKLIEGVLKTSFEIMMALVRFLPRLFSMIFEGVSKI
jgi:hypothetical protein